MTNQDKEDLDTLNLFSKTNHAHPLDLEKDYAVNFEKYLETNSKITNDIVVDKIPELYLTLKKLSTNDKLYEAKQILYFYFDKHLDRERYGRKTFACTPVICAKGYTLNKIVNKIFNKQYNVNSTSLLLKVINGNVTLNKINSYVKTNNNKFINYIQILSNDFLYQKSTTETEVTVKEFESVPFFEMIFNIHEHSSGGRWNWISSIKNEEYDFGNRWAHSSDTHWRIWYSSTSKTNPYYWKFLPNGYTIKHLVSITHQGKLISLPNYKEPLKNGFASTRWFYNEYSASFYHVNVSKYNQSELIFENKFVLELNKIQKYLNNYNLL